MEETELEVDLRPLSPAEERRKEECGVSVPGLRLVRLRWTLVRLSVLPWVLIRGLAGRVFRVCRSGRLLVLGFMC